MFGNFFWSIFVLLLCSSTIAKGEKESLSMNTLEKRDIDLEGGETWIANNGVDDIGGGRWGNKKIIKRRITCTSSVIFKDCVGQQQTRLKDYKFRVSYTSDCPYDNLIYNWNAFTKADPKKNVLSFPDYPSKATFLLKPYSLDTGKYTLDVEVLHIRLGEQIDTSTASCTLEIKPELPIAVIKGGSERYIRPDTEFIVDGTDSRNMDFRVAGNKNLKYDWKCDFGQAALSSCEGTKQVGGMLIIPRDLNKGNAQSMITITMTVTSIDSKSSAVAEQVLFVMNNAIELEMKCLKNCPPKVRIVDHTKLTSLTVKCVQYCSDIEQDDYKWSLHIGDGAEDAIKYDTDTQYGQYGHLFNIKPNILQPNTTYSAVVYATGNNEGDEREGVSKLSFLTRVVIKISSCNIQPKSGIALQTKFQVECQHSAGEYTFTIYSVLPNGKEILLAKDSSLSGITFVLPAGAKVAVVMKDSFDFTDKFLIKDVNVSPVLDPKADKNGTEKIINDAKKTINYLIKEGKGDEAIQYINALAEELKGAKSVEESEDLKKKFIKDELDELNKIDIDSISRADQVAGTIENVLGLVNRSDAHIAEKSSEVCKKISEKLVILVNSSSFPTTLSGEISNISKNLMACAESNLASNPTILNSTIEAIYTTPYPVVVPPLIVENYPDYLDDDVAISVDQLRKTSENFMKICRLNAKTMAISLAPGEKTVEISANSSTVTSTKKYGIELMTSTITSKHVEVVPSADFGKIQDLIETYLCTISYDPFWWNQDKIKVSSLSVMYLSFEVGGKSVMEFTQPVQIVFDLNPEVASTLAVIEGVTPDNGEDDTEDDPISQINDDGIVIYRVDVYSQESFFVEFFNLKNNETLNVVITHFRRPTIDDFGHKIIVSENNSKIFQQNLVEYDSWYYLGIMPSSQQEGNSQQHFNMSVYTSACYKWNLASDTWEVACKVLQKTDVNKLYCECDKLSTLAGIVKNNTVRRDQVFQLNFTMTWDTNIVIAATCIFIIFLYSVFLTVALLRARQFKRNVYFLSDISVQDRFMYIIIVKTGNKKNSGTTSNVMIRLIGTKHSSKAHVLNFPDPDNEMLQKAKEDWFVLATPKHLGDITKIQLWYDHLGPRPTWFCKSIKVRDIQSNEMWSFEVNKWFEISDVVNTFMEVYTKTEEPEVKPSLMKKLLLKFHGSSSWRIFTMYRHEHISPFVKANLMLSVLLTLCEIALLCYELPSFDISIGFFTIGDYALENAILIGLGVACLIFLYHTLLMYLFKVSEVPEHLKNSPNTQKRKFIIYRTIAWSMVLINIWTCLTLLLIFGCGVAYELTLFWLVSVAFGILFYIIILENLMLLIAKPVAEKIVEIGHIITEIFKSVEKQRSYVYHRYGPRSLRPYFRHLYAKLGQLEVQEKYQINQARQQLMIHFEDLLMFIIYLVLLYAVVMADRSVYFMYSNKEMINLISGDMSATSQFEDIISLNSFDEYIEDTLIPSTQGFLWYGEYAFNEPGMTIDMSNKYLGVVRIRQHRTVVDSCKVVDKMKFVSSSCIPEYRYKKENRDFYSEWTLQQSENDTDQKGNDSHVDRLAEIWKYAATGVVGALPVTGAFATYPDGGYILPLGRTMHNSIVNYNYAKKTYWMNNATRSAVVEFLAYCANANLFNSVTLIIEFSATGYTEVTYLIRTVKFFLTRDEINFMTTVIVVCFIIIVLFLFLRDFILVIKRKNPFFKQGWKLLDIVIITGSISCLVLFIIRKQYVETFMENLGEAKKNEFLEYFHLILIDNILASFSAFLIFIATIRVWKLMRFKPLFRLMEKSIKYASGPLLGLMVYFLLYTVSCAVVLHSLLNPYAHQFRDVSHSIPTMFLLSLAMSSFEVDSLKEVGSNLGYIFYTAFLLGNLFFTTLFVAVLLHHYTEAQISCSNERTYTLEDYVSDEYQYYKKLLEIKKRKFRSRAGKDEDFKLVYPKADEHRYANAITTSTDNIHAMYYITVHLLRVDIPSRTGLSSYNEYLMKKILFHVSRSETEQDDELYFKIFDSSMTRIVSDERMKLMEEITEILVTPVELDERRKEKTSFAKNMRKFDRIEANLNAQLAALDNIQIEMF